MESMMKEWETRMQNSMSMVEKYKSDSKEIREHAVPQYMGGVGMNSQMVESIYMNSSSNDGTVGTGAGIGAPKINFSNMSQRVDETLNITSSGLQSSNKQFSYRYQQDSISSKRLKSSN